MTILLLNSKCHPKIVPPKADRNGPPPSPRYATACRLPAPLSKNDQNPKICAMVKSMFNFLSLEYSEIYFPPILIKIGAKINIHAKFLSRDFFLNKTFISSFWDRKEFSEPDSETLTSDTQ